MLLNTCCAAVASAALSVLASTHRADLVSTDVDVLVCFHAGVRVSTDNVVLASTWPIVVAMPTTENGLHLRHAGNCRVNLCVQLVRKALNVEAIAFPLLPPAYAGR